MRKRNRILVVICVMSTVGAFGLLIFRNTFLSLFGLDLPTGLTLDRMTATQLEQLQILRTRILNYESIVSMAFFVMAIGIVLYLYLQGEIVIPFFQRSDGKDEQPIKEEFISWIKKGEAEKTVAIEEKDSKDKADEERLAAKIDFERVLTNHIHYAIDGLNFEVSSIRRNSNVNLIIGGAASAFAVSILAITLLDKTATIADPKDLVRLIPRITLAIFIEFFSFFFLRLYRRNLDEIKYLTNEITNVRLKMIGLYSSLSDQDKPNFGDIIKELIKTERNFILKKDESTVEIQKLKIDSEEQSKLIESIASILKSDREKKK